MPSDYCVQHRLCMARNIANLSETAVLVCSLFSNLVIISTRLPYSIAAITRPQFGNYGLNRAETAIDEQLRPCDELGIVRRQIQRRPCDILGLAEPPLRRLDRALGHIDPVFR